MIVHELIFWGIFGVVIELCFTALRKLIKDKKVNLIGHSSLWMFPIYSFGLSYGFDLVNYLIPIDAIRYLSYPLFIWLVELAVGIPTSKKGIRLWNYDYLPEYLHWRGIVCFAYYPLWVVFGIIVEVIK